MWFFDCSCMEITILALYQCACLMSPLRFIPWYRRRISYLLEHFNISLLMQIQFQGPDKDENPYEPKPNTYIPLSVFAILCCTGFPAFLCAITAMIYSCQVLQLVWCCLWWHSHCNSCENSSGFLRLCLHNINICHNRDSHMFQHWYKCL